MSGKYGQNKINPGLIIVKSPGRPQYSGKFDRFDKFIKSLSPGTIFESGPLSSKFHMTNAQGVGRQLSQRGDVEKVSVGVWRKI